MIFFVLNVLYISPRHLIGVIGYAPLPFIQLLPRERFSSTLRLSVGNSYMILLGK